MSCTFLDALFTRRIANETCHLSLIRIEKSAFIGIVYEGAGGVLFSINKELYIYNSHFSSIKATSGAVFVSNGNQNVYFASCCVSNCSASTCNAFSIDFRDNPISNVSESCFINSLDSTTNQIGVYTVFYGQQINVHNNVTNQRFKERYVCYHNWFSSLEYKFNSIVDVKIGRIFHFYSDQMINAEMSSSLVINNTENDSGISDVYYIYNISLIVKDSVFLNNKFNKLTSGAQPLFQNTCLLDNTFYNDVNAEQCLSTVIIQDIGKHNCEKDLFRTKEFSNTQGVFRIYYSAILSAMVLLQ